MAEAGKESNLKYLGAVHAVVVQATAYLLALYTVAKDSSGPLRPGVENVEGTVKTVVGPVYHKMQGKPFELLQFVDSKVDETLALVDGVVPQFLKEKSYQAYDLARQLSDMARAIIADVQKQGVTETASTYYQTYEPVAEQLTYHAWLKILTLPYVPQAVNFAAPAAKFGAQQYNYMASAWKEKHLPLSGVIPLVPIERIEEAIGTAPAA